LLPAGLVGQPVPHRPAARRRVAEHRQMRGPATNVPLPRAPSRPPRRSAGGGPLSFRAYGFAQ